MKVRVLFASLALALTSAIACSQKPTANVAAVALRLSPKVVAALGLPVYPNARPIAPTPVVEDDGNLIATLATTDRFELVIDWYRKHLSPDFAASGIAYGNVVMTTFADDSDEARRTVLVKVVTGEDRRSWTAITLMASSARSAGGSSAARGAGRMTGG